MTTRKNPLDTGNTLCIISPCGENDSLKARWLPGVLARIRRSAARREIRLTHKALRELAALDLDCDEEDACAVLAGLTRRDAAGRRLSETTGEWLYIFKPRLGGTVIYLKVILRAQCIVVSFHEDGDHG